MAERQQSGNRIRDRRLQRGLRQWELAASVGISPSYLNLIEHGRRRIGGKLLQDIARALDIDPAALSEGPDHGRVQALRAVALQAEYGAQPFPEIGRAEDLANQFPGWAALLVQQARSTELLRSRIIELTARLSHDHALAQALHQVISTVTSIRATAGILAETPELDRDWRDRFLRNISTDSNILAEASRSLAQVLEVPDTASVNPAAQEEFEHWLDVRGHHLAELEVGRPLADPLVGPAGELLMVWAARYTQDAKALPLASFLPAAEEVGFDPVRLAQMFPVPLPRVLRRLASLPPGTPPMGLVIADASGSLIHVKFLDGFPAVRSGTCPLWPLFEATATPGRGLRAAASLPGERAPRFLCHAVATQIEGSDWDAPPRLELTMLISPLPTEPATSDRLVGPTCRLCSRPACPARHEPSILG